MHPTRFVFALACAAACSLQAAPALPGVGAAMDAMIAQHEIAGAVTLVANREKILHLQTHGLADIATKRAMTPDSVFWIASMSKPVTGVAMMMLQDEGKLQVGDAVAKYVPEFTNLKTPSGKPANLTITQLLTHTSGLGEAPTEATLKAQTLADLVPVWLVTPMQFEPGAQWKYSQSSINLAARIVEVVSGMPFDAFLQQRLFDPLGMRDTTFYPTAAHKARLAVGYNKDKETGRMTPAAERVEYTGDRKRPPLGNGGLYSTPLDYARFCRMLLNDGTLDGKRYLSAEAVKIFRSVHTGALPTGFFQSETFGRRGRNYGWGIGACVLIEPHDGAAAVLSPGSFGHGGAWGTQAWIDPVRGVTYLLFVQRGNFPNSDASEVRSAFQAAAAAALAAPKT